MTLEREVRYTPGCSLIYLVANTTTTTTTTHSHLWAIQSSQLHVFEKKPEHQEGARDRDMIRAEKFCIELIIRF